MPRKAPSTSPVKLKQKTLTGFFSSPPAESPSPKKAPRRAKAPKRRVPSPESEKEAVDSDNSDVRRIKFEKEVIALSEDEDSPRRPGKRTLKSRQAVSDSEESASESKERLKSKRLRIRKQRLGKRKQVVEESDSEEELKPKKRKLVKGNRPSSPEDTGDEDILDEMERHRRSPSCAVLVFGKQLSGW